MPSELSKRRLAAILAADMVGYSRLMADDEHATVAALDTARDTFKSRIEANQGRVIDMAGDSVLAAFETATGAANAALDVQEALRDEAATVPADRRMRYRIGIHLGDVIEKSDGSIYGDGVNIAARLQSLGEPGDVMVSDSIRIAVRGKLPAAFEDQGEQKVKNIPDPVHAYRMLPGESKSGEAVSGGLAIPERPSIAVLPFNNMSGDTEQDYFADGITEDIITDLSLVSGLLVIARNSSFVFKDQAIDIREVGRRLGVKHVLEGSVRKVGERVRITAQLIDAQTGGHVWAERFDRDLADIFAVQDEATRKIVAALRVKLTDPERTRLEHYRKVESEAYDLMVQARRHLHRYTADAMVQTRGLLERATRIDPGYAEAFAIIALTRTMDFANGWNSPVPQDLDQAIEIANKAITIDPGTVLAYQALAMAHLWRKDYEAAEDAAQKCVALGPNYSEGFRALGQVLDFTGRQGEAIKSFEIALRLNPEQDLNLHLLGRAYLGLGRLNEAEQFFKRRLAFSPRSDMTRAYLASIYGRTGRNDLASETWRELIAINPCFSIERLRDSLPYQAPAWFEMIADGLHSAGIEPSGPIRDRDGEMPR